MKKKIIILIAIILAIILLTFFTYNHENKKFLHVEKSIYRNIYVTENNDIRCITFGKSNAKQSCIHINDPNKHVLSYTKLMLGALFLVPEPNHILIIGLGGGILPRTLRKIYPDAIIDVVEIDPSVTFIAKKYFYFKEDPKLRTFHEDGRLFIRKNNYLTRHYDLIILDAYDENYIPEHLLTQEFLFEVKAILKPGGIVAANTFSASTLYDHESATYQSVYGNYYTIRIKDRNRIIIASKNILPGFSTIHNNAYLLDGRLRIFGTSASLITPLFQLELPQKNVRILTDQYSPSNILNNQ